MKLWEPRSDESMPAYAAFAEYRDLGPERSVEQVATKLRKSTTILYRWSRTRDWVKRAQAYDAHLDSIRVAAREQSIAKQACKIMSADEVKQGLTRIAEADIADVFESDGTFDLKAAQERGVSKLIKTLNFDKDTGKIIKLETYSAHEGYRDMGKTHAIFVDKSETEDKTKSPAQALQQMLKEIGQEISLEQAEKIMAASVQRARIKAVS